MGLSPGRVEGDEEEAEPGTEKGWLNIPVELRDQSVTLLIPVADPHPN